MPVAQVVAVTEHIAGSDLAQVPTTGALWPSTALWPSPTLDTTDPDTTGLYPSGVSSLDVVDDLDFFDGGTLVLTDSDGNTEQHDFTVPPDTEGQIDLVDSLSGSFATGDMVTVLAPDGQQIPERFADVLEPMAEETVRCRVPHALYDRLALGIRDQDAGEQVTFAEDGTDVVVTDVLGKSPIQDLNSVLITTDPSQSGERVDIQADGIREIEADGTTVGVSLTQQEGLDFAVDMSSAATITRMLRWLSNSGTYESTVLSGWEDVTTDGFLLRSSGRDGRIAFIELSASSGGADASSALILQGGVGGIGEAQLLVGPYLKLLLDSTGASDFELDESAGWQDWTPTLTGWSSDPTGGIYRWKQIGKMVHLAIRQPNTGTSNATTKTLTLPVTAATITNMIWSAPAAITDNGAIQTTSGRGVISSAGTTINFLMDWSLGLFTNSGAAAIRECQISYEAA